MKKAKKDNVGREVSKGDYIAYRIPASKSVGVGVITEFTPSGNPKVLRYDDEMYDNEYNLSDRPEAVGVHGGFVKMEKPHNPIQM